MSLAAFLRQHEPVAEAWPVWGNGQLRLRQHTYLSRQLPPNEVLSSVRAILFRAAKVMVITDHEEEPYVVPGGRREPGESLETALRRELLEETGWHVGQTAVLGFIHFHHLSPKPDGYPYPYPDFVQVVYTAVAASYDPASMQPDFYVTAAQFHPIEEALALPLSPGERALLRAAITYHSGKSQAV
ncbi:MAG TPA: NUDIX hydrolase [Chloroflexota bacterium]|nr:NUDIX hydrolase [Chloroflexota bacterium]HUM71832.1 NUDIX hydrolase [Chloroflexota bacterium]